MPSPAVVEHAITQLPAASAQRIRVIDEGGANRTLRVPASLAMTALRNLLDNALRYGATALRTRQSYCAPTRPAGRDIGFSVEDQGDGLSDADIARAGSQFWRKGCGQGSGLGLSIVRAIVSRYEGSWELTRASGGGMVARLSLPAD